MGKILVTGGAGYIGSQTAFALIAQGFETVVFDSLEHGHRDHVPNESEFVQGDLLHIEDLERVFSEHTIDAVVHFASYLLVGESVTDPAKYYQNNVVGTLNLLNTMQNHGVDKIVFSSSAAVYGVSSVSPIPEDIAKQPINPYGATKLMMEQIMDDYHTAYGMHSIRLRYFNACGADPQLRTGEAHDPETHLIPLVLDAAIGARENICVFGDDYDTKDGTCIRDYVHVIDLADAHVRALRKLLGGERVARGINLGVGDGYSVMELIEAAKQVTGKDFVVKIVARRAGDPATLVADITQAREFLGWEPQHSDLDTILRDAWRWHQKLREK